MTDFVYAGFSHTSNPMSVESAVQQQARQYGFAEGQIERLEERLETLAGIVGRFLGRAEALGLTADEIAEIIGYNWTKAQEPAR